MATEWSAARYIEKLKTYQSDEQLRKIQRYFKSGEGEYGAGDRFMGVKMGDVFALSQEFIAMPIAEIEKMLESPIHEVRAGALSIMGKSSAHKKSTTTRKAELYHLYLRRHDRINNWDLVDLAARHTVGGYLMDKPRDVLYTLARSANMWERRTAAVATLAFSMQGDSADAFAIAEILVHDPEDLVHKATGWTLRVAGEHDRSRLFQFLDDHAATMPRTLLRYAIEKLAPDQRAHYMGLKKGK